jgi:hypothetical protein
MKENDLPVFDSFKVESVSEVRKSLKELNSLGSNILISVALKNWH